MLTKLKIGMMILIISYLFSSLANTAMWNLSPFCKTGYYLKEHLFFVVSGIIWIFICKKLWQKTICMSLVAYKFEMIGYTLCKFLYPETENFLNVIYDMTIGLTIIIFTLITFYFYVYELRNRTT